MSSTALHGAIEEATLEAGSPRSGCGIWKPASRTVRREDTRADYTVGHSTRPSRLQLGALPPWFHRGECPLSSDSGPSKAHHPDLIELTRVQPFEAEVIAARLRASGIGATVGVDSIYESVSFADGVPVFVSADDAQRALALIETERTDD